MHDCAQDQRIRDLTERMNKVETKVDNVQKVLDKLLWGIFATLLTSVGTLILLVLKFLEKGVQ